MTPIHCQIIGLLLCCVVNHKIIIIVCKICLTFQWKPCILKCFECWMDVSFSSNKFNLLYHGGQLTLPTILVSKYLRIEFHSVCIYWIMNAMVKRANPWSALALAWVICQFDHCVHDPINAPRMKFNPYIYILK